MYRVFKNDEFFCCQKVNLFFFLFVASGTGCSDSRGGASGGGANNAVNKYDKLVAAPDENAEHETSPKPIIRSGKEKRPQKMHHANKGKQQRDRRKLREKRRSTGRAKKINKTYWKSLSDSAWQLEK